MSWQDILKRQRTLGEYHTNFPSSHGKETYYHGTNAKNIESIRRDGLLPRVATKGRGVFVTTNIETALRYAGSNPAIFAIREGANILNPVKRASNIGFHFGRKIPPEYLTLLTDEQVNQITENMEDWEDDTHLAEW